MVKMGHFATGQVGPKNIYQIFIYDNCIKYEHIITEVCVLSTISKEVLGVYQLFHIGWYPMLTFISAGISEAMNLKVTFR